MINELTAQLQAGKSLTIQQSHDAFRYLLEGHASNAEISAFLLALKANGETIDEITGAAHIMRDKMHRISAPQGAIDVCGTGGDSKGTYNISTTVALVVAACGVPVAKHGNKSVSSQSGSSDVLSTLGVRLDAPQPLLERCLHEANICYMAAPLFHPAVREVAAARSELKTRTIFNLLGPLCNPAGVKHQLIGVYSEALVHTVARALLALGTDCAWIVHGSDGMDELTVTGPSTVAILQNNAITTQTITPAGAGLPLHSPDALQGGDIAQNTQALRTLLDGAPSAYRDAVLLNSAAALMIAGRANDLRQGVTLAAQAIDEGRARNTLQQLVQTSNSDI